MLITESAKMLRHESLHAPGVPVCKSILKGSHCLTENIYCALFPAIRRLFFLSRRAVPLNSTITSTTVLVTGKLSCKRPAFLNAVMWEVHMAVNELSGNCNA